MRKDHLWSLSFKVIGVSKKHCAAILLFIVVKIYDNFVSNIRVDKRENGTTFLVFDIALGLLGKLWICGQLMLIELPDNSQEQSDTLMIFLMMLSVILL